MMDVQINSVADLEPAALFERSMRVCNKVQRGRISWANISVQQEYCILITHSFCILMTQFGQAFQIKIKPNEEVQSLHDEHLDAQQFEGETDTAGERAKWLPAQQVPAQLRRTATRMVRSFTTCRTQSAFSFNELFKHDMNRHL